MSETRARAGKRDVNGQIFLYTHWGDCRIRRDRNGAIIAVRLPNGRVASKAQGQAGTNSEIDKEKFGQVYLFDPSEYDKNA
jgi:hypothetical protein